MIGNLEKNSLELILSSPITQDGSNLLTDTSACPCYMATISPQTLNPHLYSMHQGFERRMPLIAPRTNGPSTRRSFSSMIPPRKTATDTKFNLYSQSVVSLFFFPISFFSFFLSLNFFYNFINIQKRDKG